MCDVAQGGCLVLCWFPVKVVHEKSRTRASRPLGSRHLLPGFVSTRWRTFVDAGDGTAPGAIPIQA